MTECPRCHQAVVGSTHEGAASRILIPHRPVTWGVASGKRKGDVGKRLRNWQQIVQLRAREQLGALHLAGPVVLDMEFWVNNCRMDTTNLVKGTEDALKNVIIDDDDRVYELHAVKYPVEHDDECRAEVRISPYDGPAFDAHL